MRIPQLLFVIALSVLPFHYSWAESLLRFDFSEQESNSEYRAANYRMVEYDLLKDLRFNFTVALQNGWKILKKAKAPTPRATPVEIAVFRRDHEPRAEKLKPSEITVHVVQRNREEKVSEYLRRTISQTYGNFNLKLLGEQTSPDSGDFLFSYRVNETNYTSRIFGVRGPDELVYFLQLHTNEGAYKEFSGEAFWMMSRTFRF